MKNEPKVKKLVLRKETLRDLTAHNAGAVKGGGVTFKGITCVPTYYERGCYTWYLCPSPTVTCKPCHLTNGKPCH